MEKLLFLLVMVIGFSILPFSFSEDIPEWVKYNASWWADRQISQSEFTSSLEFLINEGIIYIPSIEPASSGPDKIIPDWVRNTAGWWSENLIPDSEFINAMKYLIKIGIIQVDVVSPEITITEDIVDEIPETPTISGKPLHILFEGYSKVYPEGKFVLDAKVFYEDVYSGTDYQHHNNKVLSGVTINVILTDEEGEKIHTASGETGKLFYRYEVMADETTLDPPYWKISHLYTVDVTASLDGQTVSKQYQFFGTMKKSPGY